MKGKKKDPEFLSEFIGECVILGQLSPDEILQQAHQQIQKIDHQILETERLKIRRSKLMDVVSYFQQTIPRVIDRKSEIQLAELLRISHPEIAVDICQKLQTNLCTKDQLINQDWALQDFTFCLKQLLLHQVIVKNDDLYSGGEYLEIYLKAIGN